MPIDSQQINELKILLPEERLEKLFCLTKSYEKAIEFHQTSLKLGGALMSVIATIEIALRNTITCNLNNYFDNEEWLCAPSKNHPNSFEWQERQHDQIKRGISNSKREKYVKLTPQEKKELDKIAYPKGRPKDTTNEIISRERQNCIDITQGDIVAMLTLHFWKTLYSHKYDWSLWRPTLKRTFPDKTLKRTQISSQLEFLYKTRNRLAHHEPVQGQRFDETINAINFVVQHLAAPLDGTTSLASLLADDITKIKNKENAFQKQLAPYR
jgi:hypothetical protein